MKTKSGATSIDFKESVEAVIRIDLSKAVEWINKDLLLSTRNLFPPPHVDTGLSLLLSIPQLYWHLDLPMSWSIIAATLSHIAHYGILQSIVQRRLLKQWRPRALSWLAINMIWRANRRIGFAFSARGSAIRYHLRGFMRRADCGCRRYREMFLRAGGGFLRGKFDTLPFSLGVP